MKIFKYFIIFIFILGLGITTWFYYPQYQIHMAKKQAVEVHKDTDKVSYIHYLRNSEAAQIYHLAIGDSIIRGVGAPKNEDLVYQFSAKLEEQIHKEIHFKNEGLIGITSSELRELVHKGHFDEGFRKADIITINVGGNDVLKLTKGQNFQSLLQTYDQLQTTFSKNLTDIAARINHLNPNATIVFMEMYNPFPPSERVYPIADKLLPNWNVKIYEIANQYPLSIVVETAKVINGEKLQNLSPDGVHPNASGYMAISDQMIYQFKHHYRKEPI